MSTIELDLLRNVFLQARTLGILRYDGKDFGFACEDPDRGLEQAMTQAELARRKIKGRTCIAGGVHPIVLANSAKYGPNTLTILSPGHRLVRIHPGNDEDDTEGCLLPGLELLPLNAGVGKSKLAVDWLESKLVPHLLGGGDAFIRIRRDLTAWGGSPYR